MADDAIRDGAIAREVGEELFLEQGRQWIVDIRRERLLPEGLEYLRVSSAGVKKGGRNPNFSSIFALICLLARASRGLSSPGARVGDGRDFIILSTMVIQPRFAGAGLGMVQIL